LRGDQDDFQFEELNEELKKIEEYEMPTSSKLWIINL
jgi:hypothetical protein